MRKWLTLLFFNLFFFTHSACAYLSMELTRGISGAVPIAIVPFAVNGPQPTQDVSGIINNDLQNSGRFKVYGASQLNNFPSSLDDVRFSYFRGLGADDVVIGKVESVGSDRYQVTFQLLDVFKGKDSPELAHQAVLLDKKFVVNGSELRPLAHHISDLIYEQITGIRGIFSTRLAYIVVQRSPTAPTRYILEVSDQDGYNPRPMLTSTDPIMSPSWSRSGKKIAYVSFEDHRASIYVQDVGSGARYLISQYPGINGAPAWSPDDRKLALVLSKSGAPNIYLLDLASKQLTQLTNDYYINTEPSWSPDGQSLIFTSNRSGNAQIYKMDLATKSISRVTYDGRFNARASYTADGNHIVVLNQESGIYNIGILDLNSGIFKVLTNSGTDTDSPSIAPNGSMVLFGTLMGGRNVLGMVATDGSVQLRLPGRNGEVQDPAWSPFL